MGYPGCTGCRGSSALSLRRAGESAESLSGKFLGSPRLLPRAGWPPLAEPVSPRQRGTRPLGRSLALPLPGQALRTDIRQPKPYQPEPSIMNRQVIPSMLLSVLIVCTFAIVLFERDPEAAGK